MSNLADQMAPHYRYGGVIAGNASNLFNCPICDEFPLALAWFARIIVDVGKLNLFAHNAVVEFYVLTVRADSIFLCSLARLREEWHECAQKIVA
jgi:hypothetical protein